MEFLCWAVQIYLLICIVSVVVSWMQLDEGGGILASIATLSFTLTEPVFAAIRRNIHLPGDLPIDVSPAIVIFGLTVVRTLICG